MRALRAIVNTIAHAAIPARAGIERHVGVHAGRSLARDLGATRARDWHCRAPIFAVLPCRFGEDTR